MAGALWSTARSILRPVPHARLAIGLVLLLCAARGARAQVQGCDDDATAVHGDFEVTPEDRAEEVARNMPIVVRFAADVDLEDLMTTVEHELAAEQPVPCAGELVCLLENDDEPRIVAADVTIDGNALLLSPKEPLTANAEHTVLIVQPGLDLVARKERTFTTGRVIDRERPVLDYRAQDVAVSVADLPPECEQAAGSRRVVLELPPATDDGDAESVELEITLTSARGLDRAELRARARNEGDPVVLSFVLGAEEAKSRVCLSVRAIDALGRASERTPSVCFNPSTRPVFDSACAAAMPGAGTRENTRDNSGGAWAWSGVLLAVLVRRGVRLRRR
jgi:hypothetical protein